MLSTLRLLLVASLVASSALAEPIAPEVPKFRSSCDSCSATGVLGYTTFQSHLDAIDPRHPANKVFHRQRQAEAFAIAGGAIGIALGGTALLAMPGTCEVADSKYFGRVNTGNCSLSTAQWAFLGAGATVLLGSGVTFFATRPREPELIGSMNAFNADHPDRPFSLSGPVSRGFDRTPLLLEPQILVPGIIAVAGVVASGVAFAEAERTRLTLELDGFSTYGEGSAIAEQGISAQRNALIFAGVSAAAFGVAGYFILRPWMPPQLDVAIGPSSVSVAGSFQ